MTIDQTPLSIGIVCASLSRAAGGILPIMQAHASQFTARGNQVVAYGVEDACSEADRASWAPVSPRIAAPIVKRFAYAPAMARDLDQASHHILHQHGLWLYPSVAVSRWRRRTGRPVVISTQGMLEPWALANARVKKKVAAALFERANLSSAACIHCSEAEVPGIRAFGLRNPVAVIPNGASLPDPTLRRPRPAWLPDDGKRTLLFLGRLHPKKGIKESLDAWSVLRTQAPHVAANWRLVVAGWDDGGHAEAFIAHARALGLSDVIFPGAVFGEAKEAAFAHADAFLLGSYSEGFPMAVLEAWSHGLPVFMTRECNIPEGFQQGAAVEVTTAPASQAHVLAQHLAGPDLPKIGARGRALVARRFSWSSVADELLSTYAWLLGDGSRPSSVTLD
ncbi:glycosyltransferase [Labrys monachus]|uniref:Poly(Glycerol-phosphate) alpha-glucosyltransferase n=1 Tax=Labrys monachus TaxID=217067 RepID=A0ABU0FJJ5_9HYPH|nr:glycosyltransferase [Labrys monachus]MDQ0394781.1 poly(glycerol-phosphate) alpha-glucosyltransferase [Labrys monachus]